MAIEVLNLPKTDDKHEVFKAISSYLIDLSLKVEDTDFDRPWGGFFVIADESTPAFIEAFFPGYSYVQIANGLALTPKILVVAPGKRLSWQYHHRREEIWSVISGPVGLTTSNTDEQGPVEVLKNGDVVSHGIEVRHRLCGLEEYGVVAEFWKHTDEHNPSDESDIVRVSDDFSRN